MINVDHLKTFYYAADSLSFSEAAKQLHLSQPSVSYQVKELEKDLNVDLFIRHGSNLELTEAGRVLLPYARKMIHQSNEVREMITSLKEGVVGQIRIACSTTAGKYILPQMAARFCQRYPGIDITILACTKEDIVPILQEGKADLGVISRELDHEQIESQEFFEDSITLIVPANHPWAYRGEVEWDELINEPIIMREPASGTRRVLISELAKHDIKIDDLNIFLELGNAEAIVRTVAAGYAISFVSTLATACPLERGSVVDVPIRDAQLRRKIYMVRESLSSHNRPVEAFWSFIHSPRNIDLLRMAGEALSDS